MKTTKKLAIIFKAQLFMNLYVKELIIHLCYENWETGEQTKVLFVCVEVLRPIQPTGVMSSAISLPHHTFTRQA